MTIFTFSNPPTFILPHLVYFLFAEEIAPKSWLAFSCIPYRLTNTGTWVLFYFSKSRAEWSVWMLVLVRTVSVRPSVPLIWLNVRPLFQPPLFFMNGPSFLVGLYALCFTHIHSFLPTTFFFHSETKRATCTCPRIFDPHHYGYLDILAWLFNLHQCMECTTTVPRSFISE